MMEDFTNSFIACGCACQSNVLDFCPITRQIVFSVRSDLAVVQKGKESYLIVETVFAQCTAVSCLKFIKAGKDIGHCSFFITGSSNGEIALWKLSAVSVPRVSLIKMVPKSSDLAITFVGGFFINGRTSEIQLIISHSDSLSFYRVNVDSTTEIKDSRIAPLIFKNAFILCFDFLEFQNFIILAVGLTNGNVEIFFFERDSTTIPEKAVVLKQQQNKWTRDLSFSRPFHDSESLFMLASTSDEAIRIWKFSFHVKKVVENADLDVRPTLLSLRGSNDKVFDLQIKLDSVLTGHDRFVQSLRWHPQEKCLLSTSMDKNVILWRPSDDEDGIWLPKIRMGEMGGEAVGFYDALFSPDGKNILFHSFFGAFYMWSVEGNNASLEPFLVGGHFDAVSDFDWEPAGRYIISCSADKTTRLFATLKNSSTLVELARPQVHGHSLTCLRSISSTCFVSGGEEKIFRVFKAPASFVENLRTLCDITLEKSDSLDYAASLPELGLSNKAIHTAASIADETRNQSPYIGLENPIENKGFIFSKPPSDDQLSRSTLFPEIHKLYGHGFEVFAVTSNHRQTLLATACKASHEDHAVIIVWDTEEWRQRLTLKAHQLTVTQMAFSPSDRFLLSVSRDRTWNIFECVGEADGKEVQILRYASGSGKASGHSRIIWSCGWSHCSRYFCTASRDKLINTWSITDDKSADVAKDLVRKRATFHAADSVTAVDFAPRPTSNGSYLIAYGQDNGELGVLEWRPMDGDPSSFTKLIELNRNAAFSSTVNRIRFRPLQINTNSNGGGASDDDFADEQRFDICACSTNHVLKIFSFKC